MTTAPTIIESTKPPTEAVAATGEGTQPRPGTDGASAGPLLEVEDLAVSFATADKTWKTTVEGVSFAVGQGEILGIVGESGCGKSVTSFSIPRLHDERTTRYEGRITFDGRDMLALDQASLRALRGEDIGFIFQNPMSSLDPLMRIGRQLEETVTVHHRHLTRREVRERCVEALTEAGADRPDLWMGKYPYQMSGGQLQRVVIAMALVNKPKLLIADEPTTALDVTIQAQLLRVLRSLRDRLGMSIILITHDMGVVAQMCDRVAVMYLGQIVETAPVGELFAHPSHPYTKGLLSATPPLTGPRPKRLATIEGSVPQLSEVTDGCRFASRCPFATAACRSGRIAMQQVGEAHSIRCTRVGEVRDLPFQTTQDRQDGAGADAETAEPTGQEA